MKRKILIVLLSVAVGASLAVVAQTLLTPSDPLAAQAEVERYSRLLQMAGSQPDTESPNWRYLSDDVGMVLRDDGRSGIRARLYIRMGDVWLPVATDGVVDVGEVIPAG